MKNNQARTNFKMSKIKVNEKEFWALKNAIADKIDNLNSVVARTDKKKRQHWVKQIQLLEDIRDRLKY